MYHWDTPIRYVRGLGPTRSKELTKIGVHTVGDLLEYPPLSWIYHGVTDIAGAKEGMVVVKAVVRTIGRHPFRSVTEATLDDESGSCKVEWYGRAWLLDHLRPGMTATFFGELKGGVLQQPKWCTYDGGMESVYGGQYGVHHNTIRTALKEVLANVELPDMANGSSRLGVYSIFHFPANKTQQQMALNTLKFDEALTLQLALQERQRITKWGVTVKSMSHDDDMHLDIMRYFPYDFTKDQQTALDDILVDMAYLNIPMQRLIHGEVGSGKTAVAFYAAMLAALNGKRTLILCPTTILADQHYQTLKGMGWEDVIPYTTSKRHWKNIVIGTHGMLNDPQLIESASLVIIDEQQKFGVEQRAKLQRHHPHLLMLSATPIPRSIAATVFGDLDVSVIRELPIRRGTVITKWVLPEKREAMHEIIEKELTKEKQAYIVYPRISGDEDVASAEQGLAEWTHRYDTNDSDLDGSDIALLTGRTSAEDKKDIFRQFKDGYIRVLISTVIAEVGLDNPNATVMVIEGADRFGLSQLHQLRGRVCRSTDTAFCFLVSETANPTSIARLEVIEKTNDGFEIAEEDLRLRGAGEVFSTRQTGLPDLHWCSLVDDYDLMIEARDLVNVGSVGSGVREMMVLKYGESLELGGVV